MQNEITKTKGQIKISFLIDTAGKTMCESIENNSNFKVSKEKLNLLIDSGPNWNYGIQNGHKVNFIEQVVLTFSGDNLVVINRMGEINPMK